MVFPQQAKAGEGGFTTYEERLDARKVRARSKSFMDFFSQATLFFNSQSEPEQNHIIDALRFELGKVETVAIRERMVGLLTKVSGILAAKVAEGLGVPVPKLQEPLNHNFGADANPADYQDQPQKQIDRSPALSMANSPKNSVKTRQIAILASDGVDGNSIKAMKAALLAEGAQCKLIAPHGGTIKDAKGAALPVDMSFLTAASVIFDAVYVPAGIKGLLDNVDAIHFINESYRHCKAIAADDDTLLTETYVAKKLSTPGVLIGKTPKDFIHAIAQHRFWEREKKDKVPA
jgi:catalase